MRVRVPALVMSAVLLPFGVAQAQRYASTPVSDGAFVVHIPGWPETSANIQSVHVEDLTIDARETTCGVDWDFRTYAPGDAHFGKATFRSRVGKNSKELLQWLEDASVGKNVRKNITVTIKSRDGSDARVLILRDAYIVAYTLPGDWDEGGEDAGVAAIVVRYRKLSGAAASGGYGHQEDWPYGCVWTADPPISDEPIPRGLAQQLLRTGSRYAVQVYVREDDGRTAWHSAVSPWLGVDAYSRGTRVDHDFELDAVDNWDRSYVTEARLRLPVQTGFDVAALPLGAPRRFDAVVVQLNRDGSEARRHVYWNWFLTRLEFPRLSAGGSGILYEEVSIKPERLTVQ